MPVDAWRSRRHKGFDMVDQEYGAISAALRFSVTAPQKRILIIMRLRRTDNGQLAYQRVERQR